MITAHLPPGCILSRVAKWRGPYDDTLIYDRTVTATQSHWILSFVVPWSLAFKLSVWLAAFALYLCRRNA